MRVSSRDRSPSLSAFSLCLILLLSGALAWPSVAFAGLFQASSWPVEVVFNTGRLHPGDFDGDGDVDVLVSETSGDELVLVRNEGEFRFSDPQLLTTASPAALEVADLDGDGHLDLLGVAQAGLVLLRGRGDATFEEARTLAPGPAARSFVLANLDGDSHSEILVLADDGSTVRVVLLDDAGSWIMRELVAVDPVASRILPADLNGDGGIDLVAQLSSGRWFEVVLSLPGGSWLRRGLYPLAPGLVDLATGDFDGDGNADVVSTHRADFTNGYSEGGMAFHYGDGDGRFAPGVWAPQRKNPRSIAVVDLDHDGGDEVLSPIGLVRHEAGRVISDSRLWFTFATSSVATADFDGDGWIDAVGGDGSPLGGPPECSFAPAHRLTFIRAVAGGFFRPAPLEDFPFPPIASQMIPARGDLDNDGSDDLVIANGDSVHVLTRFDGTAWTRALPPALVRLGGARGLALSDVDGDGNLDLFVLPKNAPEFLVLHGDGTGRFAPPRAYAFGGSEGTAFLVSDLDGDDRFDVIVTRSHRAGDSLFVVRNEGHARFGPSRAFALNGRALDLAVRRVERGRREVAVAIAQDRPPWGAEVRVVSLDGRKQSLELGDPISLPLMVQRLRAGDLDDDGEEEWVGLATHATWIGSCGTFDGTVLVFGLKGQSAALVRGSTPVGVVRVFYADLALGDFDGDGRSDVMIGGYPAEARLHRGTPTGFEPRPMLFGATRPIVRVVPGNYDGDRRIDVGLLVEGRLETLLNRGDMPVNADALRATQVGSAKPEMARLIVRLRDGERSSVGEIVPGSVRLNGVAPRSWSPLVQAGPGGDAGSDCDGALFPAEGQSTRRDFLFDGRAVGPTLPTGTLVLTARTETGGTLQVTVCSDSPAAIGSGIHAHATVAGELSPRLVPSVARAGLPSRLEYHAPAGVSVACDVFDVRGRRVQSWRRETAAAGWNAAELRASDDRNGSGLPPGVYFVDLRIGGMRTTLRWWVLTGMF